MSTPTSPLRWNVSAWPQGMRKRLRWMLQARPQQHTPEGDWFCWLALAGRGYGKTRLAAEDVAHYARIHPGCRVAVIAPTFADSRLICIEGESGVLAALGVEEIVKWNRSSGELMLTNGSRIQTYSADEPERLRGHQHHRAWCDELAAFRYPQQAWDLLVPAVRLGSDPRIIVTTTPKPIKIIRDLASRTSTVLTRGTTFDNAENLPRSLLVELIARYGGTRIGRQELEGEILEDVEGALWDRQMIEDARVADAPQMRRMVVGVDPTGSQDGAECGIIVAGLGKDLHYYVLDDRSLSASPLQWARTAVAAYHDHQADRIVAETNYGGDMIETTLRAVDENVAYRKVTASRAKQVRAEPIAALYEQSHVHHVGAFPALEDQLCSWVPTQDRASPDRLDALVWAITELLEGSPGARFMASMAPDCPACGKPNHYEAYSCRWCNKTLRKSEPRELDLSGPIGPRSDYADDT